MARWKRGLLAVAAGLLLCSGEDQEESCPAGPPCGQKEPIVAPREHPWPTARGRPVPAEYGQSPHKAPKDWPRKLRWTFQGSRGPHSTIFVGGACIDSERNVYTAAVDAIYKLNRHGAVVWQYRVLTGSVPTLHGDALYSSSKDGRFFALDLQTGVPLWETKVADKGGNDIRIGGVSDGVFITSTKFTGASFLDPSGGESLVVGVNASTGQELWRFTPDSELWNHMPLFTGEGSFVFQDHIGGVYHLRTATGEVLWKAGFKGTWAETWTDGLPTLGPNRVIYVPQSGCAGSMEGLQKWPICSGFTPGTLRAYRLDSGELLWSQTTPYSPNSQPVVTRLGSGPELTVVMAIGMPAGQPPSFAIWGWNSLPLTLRTWLYNANIWLGDWQTWIWGNAARPSVVRAYDAETGAVRWTWETPSLVKGFSAGDEELLNKRVAAGSSQAVCLPNLWASATVDAEGTAFVGHANGRVYGVRDANGDGAIDPATEVTSYDTGVAFGHPGPAIVEGMMVIVNCDAVLAFAD